MPRLVKKQPKDREIALGLVDGLLRLQVSRTCGLFLLEPDRTVIAGECLLWMWTSSFW